MAARAREAAPAAPSPDPTDAPDPAGSGVAAGPGVSVEPAAGAAYRRRLQLDVVRGSLWTVLAGTVAIPVAFVVNLLVVHALGPAEYGRFALLTVTFAVALTVVNAGVSDATTQWLAAARARGDDAEQLRLVRRCAGYHALVEAPVIGIVTLVLLHDAPIGFVVLAVAANVAVQLLGTSAVVLTATARNALAARLALASGLAAQTAVAITAGTQHTAAATWAVQAAVLVLSPALAFVSLSRPMRYAVLHPTLPWGWPPGFRTYSWSAGAGAVVAALVFGRSELFVLQLDRDFVAVGLFAVAAALAAQITVPIDSLMAPLLPASAGLMASAPDLAKRALARGIRVSALLGALTATTALPVAVVLLGRLYGTAFEDARGALIALGLASCLQSVSHPVTAFAFATRSAGAVLRINLVCLAVDLVLAVGLIPVVGLTGAVVANVVSQLLSLTLSARLVGRRLEHRHTEILHSARAFLLGPVGVVVAVVGSATVGSPVLAAAVALVLGLGAVGVGLLVFPGLRLQPDDAAAISGSLPRPLRAVFTAAERSLPLVDLRR